MQKDTQLSNRLLKLLADSESALQNLAVSQSPSPASLKIVKERFRELIIGLDGVLFLNEITEQEDGGSISCEELIHALSKESLLSPLDITLKSPLPRLFMNSARLLGALRWLCRGALRNGHSHAHISSDNRALIISFSPTATTSTESAPSLDKSILEYLIADEILSLYGHSLSWNDTEGLPTCVLPIFEMKEE